uniref:Uncharacterized protein n=1 Tax=Oryza nivara TaxID=4536 RepID=A0A0E0IB81_ORYNI
MVTPTLTDKRSMSRRIAKSNGATIPTQLPGSSLTHRGIAPASTASVLATAIAVLPHHVADPALLSVDLHHGPFRATPEAARQSSGRRWLLSAVLWSPVSPPSPSDIPIYKRL